MVEPALFGPLDTVLGPVVEYAVFLLVLANLGTRFLAHRSHVRQAEAGGADAITRHPVHQASNLLLVLLSFYYMTVHYHSGMVLSVLVLGAVLADFFELEARKVEAREGRALDLPKGAITASVLVLAYAFYVSLFFVVKPVWTAIV
ncbi:MAG: hypothetical protein ABEI39_04210 [Halobacteriales archaeon]